MLTGTPSGVGRLLPGDKIAAGVAGHTEMAVAVVAGQDALARPAPRGLATRRSEGGL